MTITELGSKEHLNSLTGLTFFAAFFVYLNHHPGPAFLPSWLTTFFTSGYNAVTIFFVLSGFVIGLNYFDSISKPSRGELVRYFAARFARVYPLYLVVLLYV
jgi:peptidoglycan/LPS O-acetylase OafA/YrhL